MERIKNFVKKLFSFIKKALKFIIKTIISLVIISLKFMAKTISSLVIISVPAYITYCVGIRVIEKAKVPESTIVSWIPFMEVQEKSLTFYQKLHILMNNENFAYLAVATVCTFLVVCIIVFTLFKSKPKKMKAIVIE